jgi:ribose/xylose/arabinose/galactoside ABC-type transport system permease subunit
VNFFGLGVIPQVFGAQTTISVNSGLYRFELHRLLNLPIIWWLMVALVGLTTLVITQTRFGRHAVAAGGNPVAARRQGISLTRVRLATFAFMGVCAGLAGVLYAGGSELVGPGDTSGLMFPAITAVILSGFSLGGGQGFLPVVLVGTLLLSTIPTALVTLGLSPSWQTFAQGALLALAVAFDGYRRRRARR